jgi:hypothetical protein
MSFVVAFLFGMVALVLASQKEDLTQREGERWHVPALSLKLLK